RHARPARPPAPARSDPVSRPAAPAASRVRRPAHGGDARPSNKPPRSPSSETAATTSPRSKRSPQTALLSPGRSDRSPPTPQLDHADLSNRVSPSMLAPSPSQHLESEIRPHGNPPYDSDIPNPALSGVLQALLLPFRLAAVNRRGVDFQKRRGTRDIAVAQGQRLLDGLLLDQPQRLDRRRD